MIENRNDDKLYLIAEARDGLLETEKDQRIAELKQDLEFTTKTTNELIEIKHKLEQQLAEKQNTIDEINKEFVQAVHDWKILCAKKDKNFNEYRNEVVSNIEKEVNERIRDTLKEHAMQLAEKDEEIKKLNWQLKDKDFTIKNLNHSLSVAPNANAGQRARIDELTKIVKEKDKEIEKLKQQYTILENENGKLAKELIVKNYKKAKTEVSFGIQLAISELEKVRDYAWFNYEKFRNYLNQQIKELKGEHDE